jgi:hypothetical protein
MAAIILLLSFSFMGLNTRTGMGFLSPPFITVLFLSCFSSCLAFHFFFPTLFLFQMYFFLSCNVSYLDLGLAIFRFSLYSFFFWGGGGGRALSIFLIIMAKWKMGSMAVILITNILQASDYSVGIGDCSTFPPKGQVDTNPWTNGEMENGWNPGLRFIFLYSPPKSSAFLGVCQV